mgnify:CR=1 FL=1
MEENRKKKYIVPQMAIYDISHPNILAYSSSTEPLEDSNENDVFDWDNLNETLS